MRSAACASGADVLETILVVILGLHLLLVDVAMAGPFVCVWLQWREARHADLAAGRVGLTLARAAHWALTVGIVLGAILLAVRWLRDDRAYFAAVASIPTSRLWFALAEILFYFACMGAYVGLWNRWRRRRFAHGALALAAATNLCLHFPALFVIISVVSTRADLVGQPLDRAAFQHLLVDREVMARVVHVWLAALAVTGAVVSGLALRLAHDEQYRAAVQRLVRRGAALALVATMLQIPAGLWVAMELPESARDPLLGGDLFATGLFALSFVMALVVLNWLANIALSDNVLGDNGRRRIHCSIVALGALVILMVGTRRRVDDYLHVQQVQPANALTPNSLDPAE